jgi:hypothetical protein
MKETAIYTDAPEEVNNSILVGSKYLIFYLLLIS